MIERGDISTSATELRLILYGLAEEYHTNIRNAADAIMVGTDDRDLQRAALRMFVWYSSARP